MYQMNVSMQNFSSSQQRALNRIQQKSEAKQQALQHHINDLYNKNCKSLQTRTSETALAWIYDHETPKRSYLKIRELMLTILQHNMCEKSQFKVGQTTSGIDSRYRAP